MDDKRRCYRFPVQGKASYFKDNTPDTNGLFITNFNREGMGIGIPYRYNLRTGNELDLTMTISPLTKPMIVTGTVMWTKQSDCYRDYALLGGIKFKRIDTAQKWELLDYVYDKWSKQAQRVSSNAAPSSEEQTLQQRPSEGTTVYNNTGLDRYSIVESVSKVLDTIAITVNDEKWSRLDRLQKHTLANTIYRTLTLNSSIKADHAYIENKEGKRLAWLLQGDTGSKHMAVAGG